MSDEDKEKHKLHFKNIYLRRKYNDEFNFLN